MYWYPFSEQEDQIAREQAEAQAEGADEPIAVRHMKCVGNLGEIATWRFLDAFASADSWTYSNKEAMRLGEPEYSDWDFLFKETRLKVDVKSTTDIRKFNPEQLPQQLSKVDGYPSADVEKIDIFVFVLISQAEYDSPIESYYREEGMEGFLYDSDGDRIASLLGWLFSNDLLKDYAQNVGGTGFKHISLREMSEFLLRGKLL